METKQERIEAARQTARWFWRALSAGEARASSEFAAADQCGYAGGFDGLAAEREAFCDEYRQLEAGAREARAKLEGWRRIES